MRLLSPAFALCLVLAPMAASAQTYLLMAEEKGCYWCARWNTEIAAIYPKTAEGRTAPLQRYDVHSDTPDVAFERRVSFTPTFLLVKDGQEVGRIEGYPGEEFFWGLLTMMLNEARIPLATED
ncbi:MAG: hypothetical protein AAFR93_10575 [Pseudomonadota bacterium]